MSTYPRDRRWRFSSRRHGVQHEEALTLGWEANLDPISDPFTWEEITAVELFELWLDRAPDNGTGLVPIYWFVEPVGEAAPFHGLDWLQEDFLTFYTAPPGLNWARLPVESKVWTARRQDKGGFITSATGWKPSALQPSVSLDLLKACARAKAEAMHRTARSPTRFR